MDRLTLWCLAERDGCVAVTAGINPLRKELALELRVVQTPITRQRLIARLFYVRLET